MTPGQDPTLIPTAWILIGFAPALIFVGAAWAVQAWRDRRRNRDFARWEAELARERSDA